MSSSTLRTVVVSALTSVVVSGVVVAAAVPLLRPHIAPDTPPPAGANSVPILNAETGGITQAVEKTEPAVVSVIVTKDVPVLERSYDDAPFPFFNPFGGTLRQRGTQRREVGGGTAFFISANGLLMTNKHVVEDEKASYTVFLNDGRRLPARVAAKDPTNDIALLQVEGGDFPFLRLAADDDVRLGQTVIAIGNALGEFRNTVSVGVISGLSRSIQAGGEYGGQMERLSHILQTDAAINSGNSGGPLLDTQGNVVGMNTAIAAEAQNIGFAIPASDLRKVLDSFQKHGRIVKPYLGIRYVPVTSALKERLNLPYDHGVLLSQGEDESEPAVLPGSPAAKAGLEAGDIVLEVDGVELSDDISLTDLIQRHGPGDDVELLVAHRGREKEVTVQLEEWKSGG